MKDNRVGQAAIDWAVEHVSRHGDTDVFPIPFELKVAAHAWQHDSTFRQKLSTTPINGADLRPHLTVEVPKTTFGFRVAHQLDPLDSILFAAMVFEMGQLIEGGRALPEAACSYRFHPTPTGDFYPSDNGWKRYASRSRELSLTKGHVLYVDLADFYNQIYHHRVRGALETCGVSEARARNVEKYLGRFTAKQSRGLPVGPYASHLLAELSLVDVDEHLAHQAVPFVRYSDDFRIFDDSTANLTHILQQLTGLLYTNHGLALQGAKTALENTVDFRRLRLGDAGHKFGDELDARLAEIAEDLSALSEEMGYGEVTIEDISEEREAGEAGPLLLSLFTEALQRPSTRLGAMKFLLREARRREADDLFIPVLDNLECLIPIIGEVSRYLQVVSPRNDRTVARRYLGGRESVGLCVVPVRRHVGTRPLHQTHRSRGLRRRPRLRSDPRGHAWRQAPGVTCKSSFAASLDQVTENARCQHETVGPSSDDLRSVRFARIGEGSVGLQC